MSDTLDADWVSFGPAAAMSEALRTTLPDRAAVLELDAGSLWRGAYLRELREYGLVAPDASPATLLDAASRHPLRHRHRPGQPLAGLTPRPAAGREVALISRFGVQKFGGVEHFVMQMARLYRDMGFQPTILGTRAERVGETGEVEGIAYAFIAETPAALFRFAWDRRLALMHVVSGLGFEVAAALRFLDVRLVFGVHFWREMFHPRTDQGGYFPNLPEAHSRRPEFELLLSDADAIYANSEFTQGLLEQQFGIRTAILPSLPDGVNLPATPTHLGRDIVLLANARMDKGFALLLKLAALLPERRFVALATQSDRLAALAAAAQASLSNVEVLDRVEDMTPLYARARAVLVPSYRFIESFSRVVIEAQRGGVPVIGSDRGNVPNLLRESGVSLPEVPAAWSTELARLFEDDAYWAERSASACSNSARYSFAAQAGRLSRLVAGLDAPVLVAVGSGVGNVIHTTPLLRNLALRWGRPVDVVVAGDSPGALAAVANSTYVRHAFPLSDVVLRRRYALVFVTQSFGSILPAFCAERVVLSRAWGAFDASHRLHEAEFNLAAAAALLGVPYAPEDISACHFGELIPMRNTHGPIGLHAGSKSGIWAAKRWPHFAELAARLTRRGLAVASFGTPDEYVPGTENRTGGSIEDMARAMRDCTGFLANDSGVMNIANALGLPLVAIFGPTEPRTRGPLGPQSVTIALDKPCAPCELVGSGGPFARMECRCIAEITVDQVETVLLQRVAAGQRLLAQAGAR